MSYVIYLEKLPFISELSLPVIYNGCWVCLMVGTVLAVMHASVANRIVENHD